MSCDTEWAVGESVLLEAVDEGARGSSDEPPSAASACGHASADAAGYVSVWDGDRQRT